MKQFCSSLRFFSLACLTSGLVFATLIFVSNSAIVSAEEGSSRTIDFHSDQSLGSLFLVPRGKPNEIANFKFRQNIGAAIGKMKITVPPGMLLNFEPNRRMLDDPGRMDSIDPDSLDSLFISASSMDDAENERCNKAVAHANHFKHLQQLVVDRSDVTDAGLLKLKDLNSLESISTMLCNVDGSCFKSLAHLPRLRNLNLWGSHISPANFKDLSLIKNLNYLNVNQTHLSDESVRQIARCSKLKKLCLAFDSTMTSSMAKYLVPLSQLEILDLRLTSVDDAALPELAKLKNLKVLDLRSTGITPTGLLALKPLHLETLILNNRSYSEAQLRQIRTVCKTPAFVSGAAKSIDKDTLRTFAPVTRHGE